jgi:hypothetical protein
MALSTYSKFYYGLTVTAANEFLDFQEGILEFTARIQLGSYTGSGLAVEIKKQMDAAGFNTYTVDYDRITRVFTISSTGAFDLLCSTGPHAGQSAFSLIGFDQSTDKTGLLTYVGDVATGKVYTTQFIIQSYKPTANNRKAIDGVVNESSSGVIEVVKFGNKLFMAGELLFITNICQRPGSIIRTNMDGVADFINFIAYCTEKGPVEFMPDESKLTEYETFILESTEQDSKGLDYELIELYDRGLAGYYRSGVLTFRRIGV